MAKKCIGIQFTLSTNLILIGGGITMALVRFFTVPSMLKSKQNHALMNDTFMKTANSDETNLFKNKECECKERSTSQVK